MRLVKLQWAFQLKAVVREDRDPKRDLTPRGIVRAIANPLAANVPPEDKYRISNHWR
jgi:hypothetical protein